MFKLKFIGACLAVLCLQSAMAQPLAEKKRYAQETQAIESQVVHLNKQCQAEIEVRFDWSNFTKEALEERSPSSFCNEALSGVI